MPKDSKYYQGRFHPKNPKKYMGDVNNIVYRSSWELHFFQWCDRNDNILRYAAEEFSIPYINPVDNRVHRYYPDALVEMKRGDEIVKILIEIKPFKQTQPPKKRDRVTKSYLNEIKTYAKNEAKWKAASEFALDNGIEFRVITENEIYGQRPRRVSKKRQK